MPDVAQAAVFRPVAGMTELTELFERTGTQAAVIFLHDPYCPVSADACEEMEGVPGGSWVVDVSHQHDLKKEMARRTGVRHESPQVFVVRDGAAVWHASHYAITRDAVAAAIEAGAR